MYFNQWIVPLIVLVIALLGFTIYTINQCMGSAPILALLTYVIFVLTIILMCTPTGKTTYESAKVGWFSKGEYCIIAVLEDETIIKSNDARFVNFPTEKLGVLKTIKHNGLGYVHSIEHSFADLDYLSTLK